MRAWKLWYPIRPSFINRDKSQRPLPTYHHQAETVQRKHRYAEKNIQSPDQLQIVLHFLRPP